MAMTAKGRFRLGKGVPKLEKKLSVENKSKFGPVPAFNVNNEALELNYPVVSISILACKLTGQIKTQLMRIEE
nr:phosphopyruvate hydratase (EC 4.2.1.11) - rat [Rattus norvegicus]